MITRSEIEEAARQMGVAANRFDGLDDRLAKKVILAATLRDGLPLSEQADERVDARFTKVLEALGVRRDVSEGAQVLRFSPGGSVQVRTDAADPGGAAGTPPSPLAARDQMIRDTEQLWKGQQARSNNDLADARGAATSTAAAREAMMREREQAYLAPTAKMARSDGLATAGARLSEAPALDDQGQRLDGAAMRALFIKQSEQAYLKPGAGTSRA